MGSAATLPSCSSHSSASGQRARRSAGTVQAVASSEHRQRIRDRPLAEVRRQQPLQGAAEGVGRGKGVGHRAHRQQPVAIHGLQPHVQSRRGRGQGFRQDEAREVVGDDHGGLGRQPGQ